VASKPPKPPDPDKLSKALEDFKKPELTEALLRLTPEEWHKLVETFRQLEPRQRDSPFFFPFYADAIFKRFVFLHKREVFDILFPDWPKPAEALSTDYYTYDGSEERMDCICTTVGEEKAFIECDNSGKPEDLKRYCGYLMDGIMRIREDTGILIKPLPAVIYTYNGDTEDVRAFESIETATFSYKPRIVFLPDILDLKDEVEKAEQLVKLNENPFADRCEFVRAGLSVLGACTGDRVEFAIRLCTAGRCSWVRRPGSRPFSLLMGVSSHLIPIEETLKLMEGLPKMRNFITDMDWATGGAFSRFYMTDATRAALEKLKATQDEAEIAKAKLKAEAVHAKLLASQAETRALRAENRALRTERQAKADRAEIARPKDAMRDHGILKDG
jgi:hypothetical protein